MKKTKSVSFAVNTELIKKVRGKFTEAKGDSDAIRMAFESVIKDEKKIYPHMQTIILNSTITANKPQTDRIVRVRLTPTQHDILENFCKKNTTTKSFVLRVILNSVSCYSTEQNKAYANRICIR